MTHDSVGPASYLTGQLIVIDGGNSVVEDKGQR
jgi:hypothetical protein